MPLSKIEQSSVNSGVAGTGPAFRVYLANTFTGFASGAWVKIPFDAADFNVLSEFELANGRFKPTVAGYYQINGYINLGVATASGGYLYIGFYKNGSVTQYPASLHLSSVALNSDTTISASSMVYMNGSTDYLEMYGYVDSSSPQFNGGPLRTSFSGFLARAA